MKFLALLVGLGTSLLIAPSYAEDCAFLRSVDTPVLSQPQSLRGTIVQHHGLRPWLELRLDHPYCQQAQIQVIPDGKPAVDLPRYRSCKVQTSGQLFTTPSAYYSSPVVQAVAGPLARSIADLELAFRIIAQPSAQDRRLSTCLEASIPNCPKQLRLAWTDEFGGVPVEAAIKRKIHTFVDQLTAAGVTMIKVCPPLNFDLAWKTWGSLVGMQGGYQRSNFSKWLGLPFTKGVLRHVPMHQNIVKPISVEKYMIALNTQDEMINTMENFLDDYDGFICPSSAVTAFPHHAPSKTYGNFNIYNQPLKLDQTDLHYYMATQAYTTPFSLTESPVLALPLGLSEEGMPVGVQVVGKRHHDFDVLALGKMLEQYTEKFLFPLQT